MHLFCAHFELGAQVLHAVGPSGEISAACSDQLFHALKTRGLSPHLPTKRKTASLKWTKRASTTQLDVLLSRIQHRDRLGPIPFAGASDPLRQFFGGGVSLDPLEH